MSLDEEALQTVAKGGLMEFEKWAGLVEPLVERLEHIVYNVFPMPKVSPEAAPSSIPHQLPSSADPSSSQLQDSNSIPFSSSKENNFPDLQTPPRPAATSTAPATSPLSERVPNSQSQSFAGPTDETLPSPLASLLDSIKSTLRSLFASKPPHTIQRLSELILYPNVHYRTLPAYLRAVDRVVSVTSSAEIFPLQMQASTNQPNGVTNGGGNSGLLFDHAPGIDESLGGALLTPIPWLNAASFEETGEPVAEAIGTESISITVYHHEVQQGPQQAPQDEQQQQPQPQEKTETNTTTQETTLPTHTTTSAMENEALGGSGSSPPADTEEVPHARGPPVVGVEDMGLQDGKGVEMPLSNVDGAGDASSAPPGNNNSNNDNTTEQPAEKDDENREQEPKGENKDGDKDISLDDAKVKNEKECTTGSSEKKQSEP